MTDTLEQTATILTNQQQIQRLTDFFTENSGQIFDYVGYTFLCGFAITIVAILISFVIFKTFSIFTSIAR